MLKADHTQANDYPAADFRVGDWLVQPRLNRVSQGATVVHVQPKIMDVLVLLAERPGEVVTREQLFRTVWAGTHVTEHALARSISELRKIFRDSPRHPRVVETIPKIGYRLIAPVVKEPETVDVNPPPETPPHIDTPTAEVPTRRHPARLWLGLGALSAATLLLTILFYLLTTVRHIGHWHPHH
jgi:DNA-binding winged helix-turn-helix (wHTH) protein